MTKRQRLIFTMIKHNQKEVCDWYELSANKLDDKLKKIEILQRRGFKPLVKV